MAKENLMVFIPAAFPSTCYVSEAAEWIAFGRVPDPLQHWVDDGEEWRDRKEGPDGEGYIGEPEGGYRQMEFRWLDVPIDWERYDEAVSAAGEKTGDQHRERFADMTERFGQSLKSAKESKSAEEVAELEKIGQEWVERVEKEAREADWARAAERPVASVLDQARASLFQALASGRLPAKGWEDDDEKIRQGKQPFGVWVSVPRSMWSLLHFDWNTNTLKTPNGELLGVQVDTDALLELYPAPQIEGREVAARIHCNCLIWEVDNDAPSENGTATLKRSRGRPPKANGMIRDGVKNWFTAKIRQGGAPPNKEALVQDCIHFVKLVFGETISRSTAQEYLSPILKDGLEGLPENAPEIVAGK